MAYQNFFFFDIETTSKSKSLFDLKMDDTVGADIFIKKCTKLKQYSGSEWADKPCEELYIEKAPLLPEFGKIICMSFGMFGEDGKLHIMTIVEDDEEKLMNRIAKVFSRASGSKKSLCGFNIKSFDIPWIVRKLYKYNIDIPLSLNFVGVKPWEILITDIHDIWKGLGRYNISLAEVCYELGIESPKKIMSGEEVHEYYWNKNDIKSIMTYCEGDVNSIIKIAEKLKL